VPGPDQAPYLRLADRLRRLIESGAWPPGHRVPSRDRLVAEYDVTPAVARRAVRLLQTEGLVRCRQGAPAHVRGPIDRAPLKRHPSPDDSLSYRATSTTELADGALAARLAIDIGDPLVRSDYQYPETGHPARVLTSWEPMSLTGTSAAALPESGPHAGLGVIARMALVDIRVVRATEDVSTRTATARESRILGLTANAAVLVVERTHFADDGRPVETANIVLPAEAWTVRYELDVHHR